MLRRGAIHRRLLIIGIGDGIRWVLSIKVRTRYWLLTIVSAHRIVLHVGWVIVREGRRIMWACEIRRQRMRLICWLVVALPGLILWTVLLVDVLLLFVIALFAAIVVAHIINGSKLNVNAEHEYANFG